MGRLLLLSSAVMALLIFSSYASAARLHEKFSQGTYYDQTQLEAEQPVKIETDNNPQEVDPKVQTDPQETSKPTDLPQPDPVDTTIPDRYPEGYPGQNQYNQQLPGDDANPESQYQGYRGSQYSTVPTETDPKKTEETIPDRYPHGYYPEDNKDVNPESKYHNNFAFNPTENEDFSNRYANGYYNTADLEARNQPGEVRFNYDPQQQHPGMNFNYNPDTTVQDPEDLTHRYTEGYYPYRTADTHTTTEPKVNNYYQQNQFRYSQFPENQPRYGYENMQGDFSAQLQGNEVPFELTGGACPTEYWVTNPQRWPKFFSMKSTVVDAFGEKARDVYGEITIMDALTDTRAEPYSKLVHNGCTAILNSYSRAQYKLKHTQVINQFNGALVSPEAAKEQAKVFEEANVSVFSAGIAGSCT
ncbi:hypothetical protein R1flu_007549 [Riccia fluitans]|uniref:Uncharacterized protein n=1 Tax=Riccia fluitans TaxID=41844 RepID=A0ABD1Z025_9MARC